MPPPSKHKQIFKTRQRSRHGSIHSFILSPGSRRDSRLHLPDATPGVVHNLHWDEPEGMYQIHLSENSSYDELKSSFDRAKKELEYIIPRIQKLENGAETLEKLIGYLDCLKRTEARFKKNEIDLECKQTEDLNSGTEGSVRVSKTLQELLNAAKTLNENLRSILDIKAAVDSEGEIDAVDHWFETLQILIHRLSAWEQYDVEHIKTGQLSIMHYIEQFARHIGKNVEALSNALVKLPKIELPTALHKQERERDVIAALTAVATIISAATAAIIPEGLSLDDLTRLDKATNTMWLLSLAFSLAATVNSLFDLFRRVYIKNHNARIPLTVVKCLEFSPQLLLAFSIVTFQAGLCLLSFASNQSLITSIFTTCLVGLSLFFPLAAVSSALSGNPNNLNNQLSYKPTVKLGLKNALAPLKQWICSPMPSSTSPILELGLYSSEPTGPMDIQMERGSSSEERKSRAPPMIKYQPAQFGEKCGYDNSLIKSSTSSGDWPSFGNSAETQEVFPNILKVKETEKKEHSELKLVDLAYSSDGKYIGVIHISGDCEVYSGDSDTPEGSEKVPASVSNTLNGSERVPGSTSANELRLIHSFNGYEFIQISWFHNSEYALLTARFSSHKFKYVSVHMGYKTHQIIDHAIQHPCYAMLHQTNAFIAIEYEEETKKTWFTVHSIDTDDYVISSSKILEICTEPHHITHMVITKDNRHLIYAEDSMLTHPDETWISVVDLKTQKLKFQVPILDHVKQLSVAPIFDDIILVQLGDFIPSLWRLNFSEEENEGNHKDLLEEITAYASPKIQDMRGKSIFCGDRDQWVIHWNQDGEVSWWDCKKGTLVRGPIEFKGLKCLSACVQVQPPESDKMPIVKLAVGHKDGRIELWTGEEAKVEDHYYPSKVKVPK